MVSSSSNNDISTDEGELSETDGELIASSAPKKKKKKHKDEKKKKKKHRNSRERKGSKEKRDCSHEKSDDLKLSRDRKR